LGAAFFGALGLAFFAMVEVSSIRHPRMKTPVAKPVLATFALRGATSVPNGRSKLLVLWLRNVRDKKCRGVHTDDVGKTEFRTPKQSEA
jgi:hypothetical protein